MSAKLGKRDGRTGKAKHGGHSRRVCTYARAHRVERRRADVPSAPAMRGDEAAPAAQGLFWVRDVYIRPQGRDGVGLRVRGHRLGAGKLKGRMWGANVPCAVAYTGSAGPTAGPAQPRGRS